jgi:hypothetical protein
MRDAGRGAGDGQACDLFADYARIAEAHGVTTFIPRDRIKYISLQPK